MNEIFFRQPLPKNITGASSILLSQKAENSLEKTNSISMCILWKKVDNYEHIMFEASDWLNQIRLAANQKSPKFQKVSH